MINGFSTLTQKGQVAIPKAIRDHFGLRATDKLQFEVKGNAIVAHRVPLIKEMRGIARGVKPLTKKEEKKIIEEAVLEKFRKKQQVLSA